MDTAKLPKFEWSRVDELNSGHTKDEWGLIPEDTNTVRVIEAYTVVWKNPKNSQNN